MTAAQRAYQEYLRTDKWRTIAAQRLALDGYECVMCGGTAENVHHRRYSRQWGEETILDLVSLCRECHARFHGAHTVTIFIEKPIPPTREMLRVKEEMSKAEKCGDDSECTRLLSLYLNMRRAQMVG